MTDTTGLGTIEAQRLELLRRKIAERGLARPAVAPDADAATDAEQRTQIQQLVQSLSH